MIIVSPQAIICGRNFLSPQPPQALIFFWFPMFRMWNWKLWPPADTVPSLTFTEEGDTSS